MKFTTFIDESVEKGKSISKHIVARISLQEKEKLQEKDC